MSRYALIVGINSYQHLPPLKTPVMNAEAISQRLERDGQFIVQRMPERLDKENSNIPVVSAEGTVSHHQLKRALKQLFLPHSRQAPETALFYFSGYGLSDLEGYDKGYLAVRDTDPHDPSLGISLRWLQWLLSESPVKQQIIWLDCCHSGAFIVNVNAANPGSHVSQDRCFIASSREFESSWEDLNSPYSVLTKALLDGLDPTRLPGKSVNTFDLVAHVSRALKGELQTPICTNFGEAINLTRTFQKSFIKQEKSTGENVENSTGVYHKNDVLKYTGKYHPSIGDRDVSTGRLLTPYIANDTLIEAVNLALYLERPLLLVGNSGCGKTHLAQAVAYELGLPLEEWNISSSSHAHEGLYTYDKEGSSRAVHGDDPSNYVCFGPLGKAFKNVNKTILLIDDIDRSNIDFPMDLLVLLNRKNFFINEVGTSIKAQKVPLVIITCKELSHLSNSFVRRCLFHRFDYPQREQLIQVIFSKYPNASEKLISRAVDCFIQLRNSMKDDEANIPDIRDMLDWFSILKQYPLDEALARLASSEERPWKWLGGHNTSNSRVERSIEFPPEYWEAGTSILAYFSRVLSFKYPDGKIKVRIEQEDLMLRMIINTPSGQKEQIEKTLEDYGMIVSGKMQPESLLDDPLEVMALKNKLEIAGLELRQARSLLTFTRDNSQKRIESLEVQVNKLHSIIEKGLQSGEHVFDVIGRITDKDKSTYNLSNASFGGGFAAEEAIQEGGNVVDLSSIDTPNQLST